MKWLAFPARPLTVEEFAEIFVLDYEKLGSLLEDRFSDPDIVFQYLPSLIVKSPPTKETTTSAVSFSHSSIIEYITSKRLFRISLKRRYAYLLPVII